MSEIGTSKCPDFGILPILDVQILARYCTLFGFQTPNVRISDKLEFQTFEFSFSERPNMIGCDFCDEWYHYNCLNLTKAEAKELTKKEWTCPNCEFKSSGTLGSTKLQSVPNYQMPINAYSRCPKTGINTGHLHPVPSHLVVPSVRKPEDLRIFFITMV